MTHMSDRVRLTSAVSYLPDSVSAHDVVVELCNRRVATWLERAERAHTHEEKCSAIMSALEWAGRSVRLSSLIRRDFKEGR